MLRFLVLLVLLLPAHALAQGLPRSLSPTLQPVPPLSRATPPCGEGHPAAQDALLGWAAPAMCVPILVSVTEPVTDLSRDHFRALVHDGDRESVIATLNAAIAADARPGEEPWRQRDLFDIFAELHPAVDAFTRDWLAAFPEDPMAQTARGLQLLSRGWAWRGEALPDRTWPERLAEMTQAHGEAILLMRRAFAARPDLVPASDGLLQLDQTVGQVAEIPVVLEQVMTVRPNRLTLMKAMLKLAPQWGGTQAQVDLLCARYAGKVQGVGGYDAPTCVIDAAYFSQYWEGPRMEAARVALADDPAEVLDYARLRDVLANLGSLDTRESVLRAVKSQRYFTVAEAVAWDGVVAERKAAAWQGKFDNPQEVADRLRHIQDFERDLTQQERADFDAALMQLNGGPAPLLDQAEERLARERLVEEARLIADNIPQNPDAVRRYRAALYDRAGGQAGMTPAPYPAFEMEARLAQVLAAFPDDPQTWAALGEDIESFGAPGLPPDDRLALFAAAEPYFANAIAYGMGQSWVLDRAVSGKVYALIEHADLMQMTDPPGLSPQDLARRDDAMICPLLRQVVLLASACQAEGRSWDQCGPWPLRDQNLLSYLQSKVKACPLLTDPAGMAYAPVRLDLSAFN